MRDKQLRKFSIDLTSNRYKQFVVTVNNITDYANDLLTLLPLT